MRTCEECGKPITGHHSKIFCDNTCKQKARAKRFGWIRTVICPVCSKSFVSESQKPKKYCSNTCRITELRRTASERLKRANEIKEERSLFSVEYVEKPKEDRITSDDVFASIFKLPGETND